MFTSHKIFVRIKEIKCQIMTFRYLLRLDFCDDILYGAIKKFSQNRGLLSSQLAEPLMTIIAHKPT